MQITFFRRLTLSPEGNRARTLTMVFNWFLFSNIIEVGERKLRFHILINLQKKLVFTFIVRINGWMGE